MGSNRFSGLLSRAGFRWILGSAVIVMALFLVLVFIKSRMEINEEEKPKPPESTEATLSMKGFHHTATSEGRKSWTVSAKSAQLFSDRNTAELSDVDLTFFNGKETPVHLSAKNGKLNTKTEDITLSGSVLGRYQGYILMTESLHYKDDSNIIYSDTPLTMVGDDSSFSAESGRFELDTDTMILKGHVLVRMNQIDDF